MWVLWIGRARHLAVGQLWVQAHLRTGVFQLYRVRGEHNPADFCTKHLARTTLGRLLAPAPAGVPAAPPSRA